MTIDQLLSEPIYFKDVKGSGSQRSATYNLAEFLEQYPQRTLYLPTQGHVDLLKGYLIVNNLKFESLLGGEVHVYYIIGQ